LPGENQLKNLAKTICRVKAINKTILKCLLNEPRNSPPNIFSRVAEGPHICWQKPFAGVSHLPAIVVGGRWELSANIFSRVAEGPHICWQKPFVRPLFVFVLFVCVRSAFVCFVCVLFCVSIFFCALFFDKKIGGLNTVVLLAD